MTADDVGKAIASILADILAPGEAVGGVPRALFGQKGCLDSMGLLTLVVQLEERVNAATGKNIRLVSADTMSNSRSPFATVDTLAAYVGELLA